MSAICDLSRLLSEMQPVLSDRPCVFVALPPGEWHALIQEKGGWTLIVDQCLADRLQLRYLSEFRRITLQVHSSLEAVGLTAAVFAKLAAVGISANVVAAYHHDHIYVPAGKALEALQALQELTEPR